MLFSFNKLVGYTKTGSRQTMSPKISSTFPGTVARIVKSPILNGQEKAQISVEGADPVLRDLRIDNTLKNDSGDEVSLKLGARVKITVEAK